MIKLIGIKAATAEPLAATAVCDVPSELEPPTPMGKCDLKSGTLKFDPDVPNTVPITAYKAE
jgi:hypothetical protein